MPDTTTPTRPAHTPGPWRATAGMSQMCDFGTTLARGRPTGDQSFWWIFSDADGHGDPDADAALIAAAPDLLAALREYADDDDIGRHTDSPRYRMARAAIARATGDAA